MWTVVDPAIDTLDVFGEENTYDWIKRADIVLHKGNRDVNTFFNPLIQECFAKKDKRLVRTLHAAILLCGLEADNFFGSHLIRLYAYCSSLSDSNRVYIKLVNPNNFVWDSIISAHVMLKQPQQAIGLHAQLCLSRGEPDGHVFVSILKACAMAECMAEGRIVHSDILQRGFEVDVFILNSLICTYTQCGSLEDARRVFDKCSKPELVAWSAMIGGYTKQGKVFEAFELYFKMQQQGIRLDNIIFSIMINACSISADTEKGKLVHSHYIESGMVSDDYINNTLVDMYIKCGAIKDAQKIFASSCYQDVVMYSSMISAYAEQGSFGNVLELFKEMQGKGLEPNDFTFACILNACSSLGYLRYGRIIHAYILENGFESDLFIRSTLIDMYSKCGSLGDAHDVFDKTSVRGVVEWTTMLSGCATHKGSHVPLLNKLMEEQGVSPDKVALNNMLKSCKDATSLEKAMLLHSQITEGSLESDTFIGTTLIEIYSRSGGMKDARIVFDQIELKDAVSWGTIMSAYLQPGMCYEALNLFHDHLSGGCDITTISASCGLRACALLGALDHGQLIHCSIIESSYESDLFVGSCLIDMYSKSGNLSNALNVFKSLQKQNVVTWTAMIGGCAYQNEYNLALKLFEAMQQEGLKPDDEAFMCLLTICNHMGLLESSHYYINLVKEKYGLSPNVDHYNCIADIMGRAGYLKEAKDLLEAKTNADNIIGWMCLLSHCKTYGFVGLGRECYDHVIRYQDKIINTGVADEVSRHSDWINDKFHNLYLV